MLIVISAILYNKFICGVSNLACENITSYIGQIFFTTSGKSVPLLSTGAVCITNTHFLDFSFGKVSQNVLYDIMTSLGNFLRMFLLFQNITKSLS